jgi:glutamyl-tRNA reductase
MNVVGNNSTKIPILFSVGVNHKSAEVEIRERLSMSDPETEEFNELLRRNGVVESVVVSTCNRTEIYGVTPGYVRGLEDFKRLLLDFKGISDRSVISKLYGMTSCAAGLQLFKVATSIDSRVIGDVQILDQIRRSFHAAQDRGEVGKVLNYLFQRAFMVGKKVRAETGLQRGAISVSLAAADIAKQHFRELADRKLLLIGAGETARLSADCIIKKGVRDITITNRTRANAESLRERLVTDGQVRVATLPFDAFREHLREFDVILTSTGATDVILNKEDFCDVKGDLLVFDLAIPRDVDPLVSELEGVTLRNVDDINLVVGENYKRRMLDMPFVNRIVMKELGEFLIWYYSLPLLPADLNHGRKPTETEKEHILRVKQFIIENFEEVHKLAILEGSVDFEGHINAVMKLKQMLGVEAGGLTWPNS